MTQLPQVVVFDVNETLSDLAPMQERFVQVGAPGPLAQTWFAAVLRDGFALTAVGAPQPFAAVAAQVLRGLLTTAGVPDVDAGVEHVLAGFSQLTVHPDVAEGVRTLRGLGLDLVTLTNGSVDVADGLLARAGLREHFRALLSVEQGAPPHVWKPAAAAYEHAVRSCEVEAAGLLLVAVHPWDVDGAARAGLRTAWLDRTGAPYPDHMSRPELVATSLPDLARQLAG